MEERVRMVSMGDVIGGKEGRRDGGVMVVEGG